MKVIEEMTKEELLEIIKIKDDMISELREEIKLYQKLISEIQKSNI